ncbi:MAG: hypothetical protein ACK55X_09180 [Synechococcaceae cyanobacterium]|jgi:hypothetical protein
MPRRRILLGGLSALLLGPLATPGLAQRPLQEVRALNFARNAGVSINGGLTVYRPQACMFTTSADTNPCLIRSDEKGFVYRFLGGPPGWQAEGQPPTLETEILVSPEGNELVRVIYNGPPRRNLPR